MLSALNFFERHFNEFAFANIALFIILQERYSQIKEGIFWNRVVSNLSAELTS